MIRKRLLNPRPEPLPASTDLKASFKATCFDGNLSLNKAAYAEGYPHPRHRLVLLGLLRTSLRRSGASALLFCDGMRAGRRRRR